jgi:UDP-N-acetylglucosamine transferase subunit ALG13
MIFVTVGTQEPFDRLIRTVDAWGKLRGRADVLAQTGLSEYRPIHIRHKPFMAAADFRRQVELASLVIAHAGMGSIITALEYGKQIIVMPRRADLGEHRNNHQIGTAKRFAEQGRIVAAYNEENLLEALDKVGIVTEAERLSAQASPILITTIRAFISSGNIHSKTSRD